ncbi:MAG: hypothetical protein J6Y72_00880 [Bacteroidales bacterium]|nr:hypothetical protein [Bacteroidales bacterium]
MAVFHIYNKESKEFLKGFSNGEVTAEPLPIEIRKYIMQYLRVLFSCGQSIIVASREKTIMNIQNTHEIWAQTELSYNMINGKQLKSGITFYPIKFDLQSCFSFFSFIQTNWNDCPLFALEKLKGRKIDGRDFLLLDNAELTGMSYPNEDGEIIEKKFRVPKKPKRSEIQYMYKKHNFSFLTNGENKTSVLIETKDPIWNKGLTINVEYKNKSMSLTCPEIMTFEMPNVKSIDRIKRINWKIKSESNPQLTSIQQAYYIYFLEHNSFPLSKENDENQSKFVDDIIAIYKPIEENKTAEQEHHKSCENTIKKYQKFKEAKNEGALLKEIRDTIYEMNAEIERISPFLIIRKEDLEVNSSQYIIPLEWLKKSF